MQDHTRYPNLTKAVVEMAYDNGAVNRDRTEENLLQRLDDYLGQTGHDHARLAEMDDWFAGLTNRQISVAVAGEESEMQALLATAPWDTGVFLDGVFDEVL